MKGGVIVIVVALLVIYIGATGKYKCITAAFTCLTGDGKPCDCTGEAGKAVSSVGSLNPVGTFPTIMPLQAIRPIGA